MPFQFLRSLRKRPPLRSTSNILTCQKRSFRPAVEQLEDRTVPTISLQAVSVADPTLGGGLGNGESFLNSFSISPDGRYVAFTSSASNLVAGDVNGTLDVFVRDTLWGSTTRVSADIASFRRPGGHTGKLALDGNGVLYAAFTGFDAFSGFGGILVKNLSTGAVSGFVNTDSSGNLHFNSGNSFLDALVFDRNGTGYVAFTSDTSSLVPGDTNNGNDVFVKNLSTGVTTRVSTDSAGNQALFGGNHGSGPAALAIDRNGDVLVAFGSYATNLVSGDTNAQPDVFVKNLTTGVTTRVSTDSAGNQANNGAGHSPALAVDGSGTVYLAFSSVASNLVSNDTNQLSDVFVKNLTTGVTTRASTDAAGDQANGESSWSALAVDSNGSVFVAFASRATNLVDGPAIGGDQIFVKDVRTGRISRVGPHSERNPRTSLAVDGSGKVFVTFMSYADNLVSGDNNFAQDVFLATIQMSPPASVAPTVIPPANQTATMEVPQSFNLGSFSDPDGGAWNVVVDWGDLRVTSFSASSAGSLGTQSHTYAQPGNYTVTITVTDSTSLSGLATFQVEVAPPIRPDIDMRSAQLLDAMHVQFSYSTKGNPGSFQVGVYRSADQAWDPSDLLVSSLDMVVPSGVAGIQTAVIGLSGKLPIDAARKYVLVVATPADNISEADATNNTAFFRKLVLGAVAHGFDPLGLIRRLFHVIPPWVNQVADALEKQGYSRTIRFDWTASSLLPIPNQTYLAGQRLAQDVTRVSDEMADQPHDVIDVHFIGHSRGAVVISQALLALDQGPSHVQLGYFKMTMLDPHPARNKKRSSALGFLNLGKIGSFSFNPIWRSFAKFVVTFQSGAKDPAILIPSNVDEAEMFYQRNIWHHTSVRSIDFQLNLWGQLPREIQDPFNRLLLKTRLFGVGHTGIPDIYLKSLGSSK